MYARDARLIQQKYTEYLLPSVLSVAALAVATVVDGMLVGNLLGADALSGVGACAPVIALLNAIFMLFSVGGVTVASVALGRREREKADAAFTLSIGGGFAGMGLFVLLVELAAEPLCALLCRADPSLAPLMIAYLRPVVFVGPMMILTLSVSLFMRLDGYPKMASTIAVASNLVNLACDYVFIHFFGMGLTGAGLSTTLGYVAGIVCVLPWLRSKERSLHFAPPQMRLLPELLSAGAPKMLVYLCDFVKKLFLNTLILRVLGKDDLAVLTVCNGLTFFATSITNGGSDAFLPIVGSLFGEQDYFGLRGCVRSALRWILGGCGVLMMLLLAAPGAVCRLYGVGTDGSLPAAVRMLALYLPFMGTEAIFQTFYNTTGRNKLASLMSLLSGTVYVCAFAALLAFTASGMIWLCFACSSAATLLTVFLLGGRIRRKEGAEGVLLLPPPDESIVTWNATIPATNEAAAGISEQIIDFCSRSGMDAGRANRIGVATEEMAVATAQRPMAKRAGCIVDIRLLMEEDGITLHFRSNGAPFDPTASDPAQPPQEADGVEVMKKMAKSAEFSRQLGFNTLILRF